MRTRTLALVLALGCLPFQIAAAGTKVVFSFGKVEALRAGSSDWEYVRSGGELRANDLVRIPPQGLLRLSTSGSRDLALLAGTHETTLDALLIESRDTSANRSGRRVSGTSPEPAALDVLPAGDPAVRRAATSPLRFTDAEFAAWKRDVRDRNPLVRDLAQRVTARVARHEVGAGYPTPRLQLARGLFDAMRIAVEDGSPVAAIFPEGDARAVYLYAALLGAAEVPFERIVDDSRRPIVLVHLIEPATAAKRVSANTGLVRRASNDRLAIPLAVGPATPTFLDAWYAAENAVRSRSIGE